MAHNNHTIDHINKEYNTLYPDREAFLRLTDEFESKLDKPIIKKHDGIYVIREDLMGHGGTKVRAAEYLFSTIKEDTIVYCMPRVGHASAAVIKLAILYNKNVILFAPACKEMSNHQANSVRMLEEMPSHLYGKVIWRRIAAMPNLNRMAMNFAKENQYKFLPFGLDHPYTIAGFVRVCHDMLNSQWIQYPKTMWTVVSTGVLTRGLQIGFLDSNMQGVAVARNMKSGELGRTKIQSDPLAFTAKEKQENLPPFDSVATYDAKAWKYIPKNPEKPVYFWNVAGEIELPKNFDKSNYNTYRDWNDESI